VIVNSIGHFAAPPSPALLAFVIAPLAHLRPLDIAVIAIYFGIVIWIGFYLKGRSNTAKSSSWPGAR